MSLSPVTSSSVNTCPVPFVIGCNEKMPLGVAPTTSFPGLLPFELTVKFNFQHYHNLEPGFSPALERLWDDGISLNTF